MILEIQKADELALLQKGYTEDGPAVPATEVFVLTELVDHHGVIQQHRLLRSEHILQHVFGKLGRCHRRLSQTDLDSVLGDDGFSPDSQPFASAEDQQAAVTAGVFEYDDHQSPDQSLEAALAGHRLRRLDHRSKV